MTADAIHWGWYMPYGLLTPASWVAMFTQRWMHLTGVTKDALFEVAHSTREYAVNNPEAFFYAARIRPRRVRRRAHDLPTRCNCSTAARKATAPPA